MTKKTPLILSILLAGVGFLAILQLTNKPTPSDLILNTEVNLGEVNLASKRSFKVTITNPTRKNFELAKIYTSCGCTKAIDDESKAFTLKPKETLSINFEFDPALMHQKGDTINHEAYFLVTSPIEKEYKVKIIGEVV